MADPFQNVDAAGADFIKIFADAMDLRQNDPTMEKIVATYLEALALENPADVIEIGAGAGAVSRRIAAQFPKAKITGYEPSQGFVTEARSFHRAKWSIRWQSSFLPGMRRAPRPLLGASIALPGRPRFRRASRPRQRTHLPTGRTSRGFQPCRSNEFAL